VREGSWIDYYSCRATPSLVNPVNELEFGIGLAELDFQTQFGSRADIRFLRPPMFRVHKSRVAGCQQIQIWAVQNVDYRPHFFLRKFPVIIDLGPVDAQAPIRL
jgi:hypothetical protein